MKQDIINIEKEIEKYLYNPEIRKGGIVRGRIVDVSEDYAIVDLGFKIEGKIRTHEIDREKLKIGETVEAQVVGRTSDGLFMLSYKMAKERRINEYLSELFKSGKSVIGTVVGKTKRGYEVDVGEFSGLDLGKYFVLCPFSEAGDIKVGGQYEFAIKKNEENGKFFLSRKAYLQMLREEERKRVLSSLKVGAILEAKVVMVTNFYAEVDFGGGIRGKILRDDVDWNRVESCKDKLKKGQVVKVKILEMEPYIRASIKHVHGNPWEKVTELFKNGDVVEGEVSDIKDFGVFVKIKIGESDIEALLPFSEAGWDRGEEVKNKFYVGQSVSATIINILPNERKITLSLKKMLPNPYDILKNSLNKERKAVVRVAGRRGYVVDINVEEAGAKIRAFLPKSEVSWFINEEDSLKEGDEIEVKVLSVRGNDVIVSRKKVNEDFVNSIIQELSGKTISAKVAQEPDIRARGLWVVFEYEGKFLRGFIPVSELASKISSYSKDETVQCELVDYSKNIDAFILSENKSILKEIKKQTQGVSLGALLSQIEKKNE